MGFHVAEYCFLYHLTVSLIIKHEKCVNLNHIRKDKTKEALMMMYDEFSIHHTKSRLFEDTYSYLSTNSGKYVIPQNQIYGDSTYQCVMNCKRRAATQRAEKKNQNKEKVSPLEDADKGALFEITKMIGESGTGSHSWRLLKVEVTPTTPSVAHQG